MRKKLVVFAAVTAVLTLSVAAVAAVDFGAQQQKELKGQSTSLFGVTGPLDSSSPDQVTEEEANADPQALFTLAKGLSARVVSSGAAGANIDMMALWPDSQNPTWLIACNEEGTTDPGVQRINIASGAVETIVTGTSSCDGVRRTSWGTILFSEEAGGGASGGRAYELIDPVNTTGVSLNRSTGVFSGGVGASNLTARPALGRLSFEGFALYPNGVVYYGDENRPNNGTPGGAYFKFIPSTLWDPSADPITELGDSPVAAGSISGLRLGKRSGSTDYGQGTQTGFGSWIPVCAGAACNDADLRAQTASLKLTGYYRPEDLDIDGEAASSGNVRFCGNNTGNEGDDQQYGETVCFTDGTIAQAAANTAKPEVQLLVVGNPSYAMPDNIAWQPGRANWIVHEDADTEYLAPHNNDLWDCLPDGSDPDLLSDGCVRIATLNDLTAEWTGGIFDATGKRFFVSVQHNVTGHAVVIEVTGWK